MGVKPLCTTLAVTTLSVTYGDSAPFNPLRHFVTPLPKGEAYKVELTKKALPKGEP